MCDAWKSWVFLSTLIVGCGGGGSGSADDNDNSIPQIPQMLIEGGNAHIVFTVGVSVPEAVLQVSQSVSTSIFELTRPLVRIPFETTCGVLKDGKRIIDHNDIDSDGAVSVGDLIEITFQHCFENSINDKANGTIYLDVTEFSLLETGELNIKGGLTFDRFSIQVSNSDSLDIGGKYDIHYQLNMTSELLSATASGNQAFEVTGALEEKLSDFSITKNSSFVKNEYSTDFSGYFKSNVLGFDMECETLEPLLGEQFPIAGSLSCMAKDGSYAKLVALETSPQSHVARRGDGFNDFAVGDLWLEYAEGFIFSLETHRPRSLEADIVPLLDVDSLALGESAPVDSLAFDSANNLLYVLDHIGVSIVDPVSRTLLRKHIITNHSDGDRIKLSADGSMLYLATVSAIRPYSIPDDGIFQNYLTGDNSDFSISPSDPKLVAVSVRGNEQVVVYRDGMALPNTLLGEGVDISTLAFNDAGDKIYALTSDKLLVELLVLEDGVDVSRVLMDVDGLTFGWGGGPKLSVQHGQILFDSGWRIDINTRQVIGQFGTGNGFNPHYKGVIVDSDRSRAYAFSDKGHFQVFDVNTMTLRSRYLADTGVSPSLGPVVDMEEIGIAFVTSDVNGYHLNFVEKSDFQDQPISVCSSHNFDNVVNPLGLKQIRCKFKDAVFNPANNKVYATVHADAGVEGNSLMIIDPETGIIEQRLWLGSSPGELALSADGSRLYVALEYEFSIMALDPATLEIIDRFPINQTESGGLIKPVRLTVSPTNPLSVVVSGEGLFANFVDGVRLPNDTGRFYDGYEDLHFSSDGSMLYGIRGQFDSVDVYSVDGSGVQFVTESTQEIRYTGADMQGDYLLSGNGNVIQLSTLTEKGVLDNSIDSYEGGVVDIDSNRFYTLKNRIVTEYDGQTLTSLRAMELPLFIEDEGSVEKMFNIGENKLGVLWGQYLDIYDKEGLTVVAQQ